VPDLQGFHAFAALAGALIAKGVHLTSGVEFLFNPFARADLIDERPFVEVVHCSVVVGGESEAGLESVAALGHGQLQGAHLPVVALRRCSCLAFVGDVNQHGFRFGVPLVVTALACREVNGAQCFAVAKVF